MDGINTVVQTKQLLKYQKPMYGQLVIGPPGSGKTTYCYKMYEFCKKLERNVCVINLDPANEQMLYTPIIDIMKLITVEDAMEHLNLGPNGALIYCIEYLEKNIQWLFKQLETLSETYFIFDCPGQVELYTHHNSIRNIFTKLVENYGYSLCTVHLIDSHYCSEPTKFIATIMLSLNTMLQIGLPHVNVLSKADLLKKFQNKLIFNLDFYTEVLDLKYLLESLDTVATNSSWMNKYKKLNTAIVSMIEDYSLVNFQPLDCNRNDSLLRLKNLIDKANGYCYGATEEKSINSLLACAVGCETESERMHKNCDAYL